MDLLTSSTILQFKTKPKKFQKFNHHDCLLPDTKQTFKLLPPNANRCQKFLRYIQTIMTINIQSERAKRFFRSKSLIQNEQKRHVASRNAYIIHPFSKFNRVRQILFIILWTYDIFVTPIRASFGVTYRDNFKSLTVLADVDNFLELYVHLPLQVLIIISFFFTGYSKWNTKQTFLDPIDICKRYLRFFYVIDVLSILPSFYCEEITLYVRFLNMFAVLRVGTVLRYVEMLLLDFHVKSEVYLCIVLSALTLSMLNLFSCLFLLVPSILYWNDTKWNEQSWISSANLEPSGDVEPFTAYTEILICIVCHFFGAGKGYYPLNNLAYENLLLSMVMITGRLWTLYVIATMLRIFSIVTISETKYEEYLLQLEVFMRQKKLPKHLRTRLLDYYKYKYQNHFFNEQAIFATLSTYLRQELLIYRARHLIGKVELFKFYPKTLVGSIIGSSKVSIYLKHDVIEKQDNPMNFVHFISSGTVAVYYNALEIAHLEDGDEIGIIGVLGVDKTILHYKYTYVAIESTEIYTIGVDEFRSFLGDKGDLLKYFAERVQARFNEFKNQQMKAHSGAYDLLSELSSGKILERPRLRTRPFDN